MVDLDIDLVKKASKGDLIAFERLVKKYEKTVYNILLRILGNEEDAKDLSQEVFIKVYNNLSAFKGRSKFYTWLYRICVNTAIDYFRGRAKDTPLEIEAEGVCLNNPSTLYDEKEKRIYILKTLSTLSAEHRTVIILRDMHGFSYKEISEILDISIGTVKSRINRARSTLREKLLGLSYPFREEE